MRIAVVGKGMIGSAAARYLALAGHDVVLVGPAEPTDKSSHTGVFASLYDAGRITRGLDVDPFWSAVSRASIARYRALEAESGIAFYTECGAMIAGPQDSHLIKRVADVRATGTIASQAVEGADLATEFPYFRFAPGTVAFHETHGAGHINPRRMVAAQVAVAKKAGAEILDDTITHIEDQPEAVILFAQHEVLTADRVLLATGAFTNALLVDPLPLRVYARTVSLFEVVEGEATRLSGMPSLVYLGQDGRDSYLLPPIRYPDGKMYLKLGGDPEDQSLDSPEAIAAWFRSGGSTEVGQHLERMLRDWMPGLTIRSVSTDACVTCFTPRDRPIIDLLSDRMAVAAPGCGRGAKCSDELGRLAAAAVLGRCDTRLSLRAAQLPG